MKISQVIKDKRKEFGFNQEELADKIFVSKKTISNWETGKTTPDLESILRLSDLFNLSLDELIKGDKSVMEKIKEDTDTVSSNKKIMLIVFTWMVAYLLIFFSEIIFELPKVTNPFVNGLFIMLVMTVGVYLLIKSKFEYLLARVDTEVIFKTILLVGSIMLIFFMSAFLNGLMQEVWQQNIIRIIATISAAMIGKYLFMKKS